MSNPTKYQTADDVHQAVREHPNVIAADKRHADAVKALHAAHDERIEVRSINNIREGGGEA